jgi:branched-chain amino acid transport system permease protein
MNYLQVSPLMGEEIGNRGVAAMIVGGMGSVWGAVLGGLLIGVCEVLGIHFFGAGFANIVVYGMLLAILMFKPEGLLGGSTRVREKL